MVKPNDMYQFSGGQDASVPTRVSRVGIVDPAIKTIEIFDILNFLDEKKN